MRLAWQDLEDRLAAALAKRNVPAARDMAWATVWLEACNYPGLTLLGEGLADEASPPSLARDALGIDLGNISCLYFAPALVAEVMRNGRAFLRNVRHGLFLVPFSVRDGLAIGCPVDPAFALGGTREKNPYTEKLAATRRDGLAVDGPALAALGA